MIQVLRAEKTGTGDWTAESVEIDPVTRKPYPPIQVYPDFHHPVTYADRIWPAALATTWTRAGDGLEVTLDIRTTPEDGPVAYGFSVVSQNGLSGIEDYRLPIPRMSKRAAKVFGFAGTIPTIRKGKPLIGDEARMERLEVVAEAYLEAEVLGVHKGKHIREVLDEHGMSVSLSRIYHLVSEAKDEELPPREESK